MVRLPEFRGCPFSNASAELADLDHGRVRVAVEQAMSLGCAEAAAILHLATAEDLVHTRGVLIELGELSRFERPLPVITNYDALLGKEVAS